MMSSRVNRRRFLQGTAGIAGLSAVAGLPISVNAADKVVKVGSVSDLTSDAAGWGLPAYRGYDVWAELVNEAGGMQVGGDSYTVEVVAWDDEFLASKALTGVKKLVLEDDVKLVTMLCSTPVIASQPFLTDNNMISATTCTTDLGPGANYLLSAVEVHPFYVPPVIDWMAKNDPSVKTAALLSQDDELGIPSLATYRLAMEMNGIEIVHESRFSLDTMDFAPVMSAALASKPDMLCFDTTYPDFMNLMIEQAYLQGFRGRMSAVTLDNYPQLIEKTSEEFLEGFLFVFPDFDDPRMAEDDINFDNPGAFYRRYNERFPGTWTSQSWTFAAVLELWKKGCQAAGSVEPMDVYAALQAMDPVPQIFGDATWWGGDVFGVNNALVGRWPVVELQKGKAKIVEMGDVAGWLAEHQDALIARLEEVGMIQS